MAGSRFSPDDEIISDSPKNISHNRWYASHSDDEVISFGSLGTHKSKHNTKSDDSSGDKLLSSSSSSFIETSDSQGLGEDDLLITPPLPTKPIYRRTVPKPINHGDADRHDDETQPFLASPERSTSSELPFKLKLNEEPALPSEPKPLWRRALNKVTGMFTYVKDNPTTAVLSFLTSAQPAINAFLSPTNSSPKDISLRWWNGMSKPLKVASSFVFFCSLILNILLGMFFLPQLKEELTLANIKKHPISASVSLFLGLAAAVALGMLTYESLSSFTIYVAAGFAAFSLGINFVTRFVSVKRASDRTYDAVFPDARKKVIKNTLQHLEKLNPAHTKRINQRLAEIAPRLPLPDQLTPQVIRIFHEELLKATVNEIAAIQSAIQENPRLAPLFEKQGGCSMATLKRVKNGAFTTAEITLGITAAAMGYLVFTDKGFAGLEMLEGLFGTHHLSDLPTAAKIAIGSGSGFASGMLYFISLQDLRAALGQGLAQLSQHPAEIPLAIGITLATIASAFSMYNVAANFMGNHNNLFATLTKNIPLVIEYGVSVGALGVNSLSAAKCLFSRTPDRFSPDLLEQVIEYVANKDIFTLADKEEHFATPEEEMSAAQDKEAIKVLSELTLFNTPPSSPKRDIEDHMEKGYTTSKASL